MLAAGGLTVTPDGFTFKKYTISIICLKKILNGELVYLYSLEHGEKRIGQVISSKKLPFEDDPKRDNKIVSILVREDFTKDESENTLFGMVEGFNSLPLEKIQELKAIPEKEPDATKLTIEERYGATTYSLAQKILVDPYSFQIVRHVLDFGTAGEYQKKMLVFTLVLTVLLGKPTWIITSGKSGEGKSNLLEGVFELLPRNMKERMNSGKMAAIYRKSLEDPYYYAFKVIYFGDLGDMNEDLSKSANAELKERFSIFRQLSSEGEVRRPISIKNEEGEWESVEMTLKGRPLLMFSTTATEFDAQIQSRAFVVYPSMTSFQNNIVACFQRVENMLPATQRIPEEIAILRKAIACAIEILAEEKIKVINPFTDALDAGISADSPNLKRDRPKIYSLVNAITLWNSRI